MDHRVIYLRDASGNPSPSFMLSLFTFRLSPIGHAGHVAWLRHQGRDGPHHRLTDDLELAATASERFAPSVDRDRFSEVPWTEADFESGPDPMEPDWLITAVGISARARWSDLGPPIFAFGPSPGRPNHADIHSLLREAGGEVWLDDEVVVGDCFANEIWVPWLGRPLSSCLVAIGEVLLTR